MNSKLFIILIGALFVYGWHLSIPLAAAQDAPLGDPGRRVVDTGQTPVTFSDPTVARGQGAASPPNQDSGLPSQGPSGSDTRQVHQSGDVVHPQSRTSDSTSSDTRQVHQSGDVVHPQSRTPDSHGYLRRVNKEKYIPQSGSADVKWNTPCESPKCLGAVSTKPSVDVYRSQVGDGGAQGLKSLQGSHSVGAVQGRRR